MITFVANPLTITLKFNENKYIKNESEYLPAPHDGKFCADLDYSVTEHDAGYVDIFLL